ncbi:alpha/beta fold hydrolase [Emticicia sp. CRIBPO]|uniref:alpha/beta fold hydrolase n=1 Tax=Emticicia sp. CRIBPO TaxID=2683258 RepID=UPI001412F1B8|nr:alpha/beta hydrolase [Emticicia sp. CRIBPO]NBA85591.1 alpha/beta fold hydrolase [Emticicia sp. CRIBPO]
MKKVRLTALLVILSLFGAFAQNFKVRTTGKGAQTLIFIPGFACSDEVWNATIANFEKDYTCISLTMPGFAGVPAEQSPTFEGWKTQIASYIQSQKISKPVIVGHSMGGVLAMAVAADYPDLAGGVVVVDALPCLAAMMDPGFKSNPALDCSPAVSQITTMSDEQFLQMQKAGIPRMMSSRDKDDLVIGWTVKSDRKTFAGMFCDFSNTDLRERISEITCPVLVLLESYFVNFKPGIEGQYKNLKTARLEYATKGLHFIMYDDKEWFDDRLTNFIRK